MKKPRYVFADWKDDPKEVFEATMYQVNTLLRRKGLKIYVKKEPFTAGSDTYGWMLNFEKMTSDEARDIAANDLGFGEEYHEDLRLRE